MAKVIEENENTEQFTSKQSNILYREHLEYTSKKIFWSATIGLSAVAIYASLVYLVVQQLRK